MPSPGRVSGHVTCPAAMFKRRSEISAAEVKKSGKRISVYFCPTLLRRIKKAKEKGISGEWKQELEKRAAERFSDKMKVFEFRIEPSPSPAFLGVFSCFSDYVFFYIY